MARIKPLVWIVSLLIGQLALAASQSEGASYSPDPALQVTPHLGPPPKPGKKNARTRQRPAPAKAPRDKKGRTSPAAETTSTPALPPSAAQVFLIQHYLPERVDPDLAQPMVAKMSAPAPRRAAASTVVIVPVEPAADIPMDVFVAWAKETTTPGGRPNPRPVSAVKSQEPTGASLFASITGWLRETTPSAPPVEPIVMVPAEPAADISMDAFVAWAKETTAPVGRPDPRPVSVVKSQEPIGASLFASITGWLSETTLRDASEKPVEMIVMVPVEPAPDLPMEVFTAWASQSTLPAPSAQPEELIVMVSVDPAPDLPMEVFTAWAAEATLPDVIVQPVEPIVMVAVEPAADLPMENFTAWASAATPPDASAQPVETIVMVPVDPAPDLPMEAFTAWASEAEGANQADVVIELEAFEVTPDLSMASFAEWAKEPTSPTIEEVSKTPADQPPATIEQPAPELDAFEPAPALPMEVFTEWAKQPEIPVVAPSESSSPTATPDTAATLNVQTEIEASDPTPDLPMESFVEWAQAESKSATTPALQTAQ